MSPWVALAPLLSGLLIWPAPVALRPAQGEGREWHVSPGSAGDGSATRPFGSVAQALGVAAAGDVVLVAPGTYAEGLQTVRGGSETAPLLVRAWRADQPPPVMTRSGRVVTLAHPHVWLEGLVFDGQYGADDTVRVTSAAHGAMLTRVEVRRSSRDCVDLGGPAGVIIEHSLIHHCLNAANGRTDAHGVVAGAAQRLVIRDTEIHTFSGDAIQLDPDRATPGWTDLRLERVRLWLAPLPAPANGFAAGVVPGENALDTKTSVAGARATVTVTDARAWGFRGGLITNMAAFNIKERVDAVFDGVTVHDSEIAFRLRGPVGTGATAVVRNAVVHHVDTAFRVEDDIADVRLHHATVGRAVSRVFRRAASAGTVPDVRNLLVLGPTLPAEAQGAGLAVAADAFVDAATDDYRLAEASAARDRAPAVAGTTLDRVGITRPQGLAADYGAYEYCARCPPRPPGHLRRR